MKTTLTMRVIEPEQQLPESLDRLIHEMPEDYADWPKVNPYPFGKPCANRSTLPEDDGNAMVGIRNGLIIGVILWGIIIFVWRLL